MLRPASRMTAELLPVRSRRWEASAPMWIRSLPRERNVNPGGALEGASFSKSRGAPAAVAGNHLRTDGKHFHDIKRSTFTSTAGADKSPPTIQQTLHQYVAARAETAADIGSRYNIWPSAETSCRSVCLLSQTQGKSPVMSYTYRAASAGTALSQRRRLIVLLPFRSSATMSSQSVPIAKSTIKRAFTSR